MSRKALLAWAALSGLASIVSIVVLDQPIAKLVEQAGGRDSPVLQLGMTILEILFGFGVSRFALSGVLLLLGFVLLASRPWHRAGRMVLFVAVTHLTARLLSGVLKTLFQRERPFEALAQAREASRFFVPEGDSFPSGHAAYFWGLYFPLAVLFPRFRAPLALLPAFVSFQRVGVNDHFLSDVLASATLAALLTLFYAYGFRVGSLEARRDEPAGG